MFCPKCGTDVNGDLCTNCGTPINPVKQEQNHIQQLQSTEKKKTHMMCMLERIREIRSSYDKTLKRILYYESVINNIMCYGCLVVIGYVVFCIYLLVSNPTAVSGESQNISGKSQNISNKSVEYKLYKFGYERYFKSLTAFQQQYEIIDNPIHIDTTVLYKRTKKMIELKVPDEMSTATETSNRMLNNTLDMCVRANSGASKTEISFIWGTILNDVDVIDTLLKNP